MHTNRTTRLSIHRSTADRPPPPRSYEQRWWALAVLCLNLIIVFAGNATLNVALPALSRDLHASSSQLQWVVSIYSLVFAGALFTTGAIGDRFGRKGALQWGLVLYLAGSLAATFSTSTGELIACRAVMGLAGAMIMPSTLSILINIFPANEQGRAVAIWAACIGAAPPLGPVLSGVLLAHFWYGSAFLVNVPIVAVALVAGRVLLPASRDPQEAAFDPGGALTSVVGIAALVYALIQAPGWGWGSAKTLSAFGLAAGFLVAFVLWEQRSKSPMLDISYFKNRAFSTATAGMTLVFLSMYGALFLVFQHLELVLGYSPLSTAIRVLPMTPIMMGVAPLTPRLSARFGAHRTVAAGMLLVAAGLAMVSRMSTASSYVYVLASFVPWVTGIALTMSPITSAIMSAVPARRAGAGAATNDATRELGAALGVAVLGSLAASRYRSALRPVLHALPAAQQHQAASSLAGALQAASRLHGAAGRTVAHGAAAAFVGGVHFATTFGVILALSAAVVVWRHLPSGQPQPARDGAVTRIDVTEESDLEAIPA
jgi:EmrB/QacA subfamily drug resistance transporter